MSVKKLLTLLIKFYIAFIIIYSVYASLINPLTTDESRYEDGIPSAQVQNILVAVYGVEPDVVRQLEKLGVKVVNLTSDTIDDIDLLLVGSNVAENDNCSIVMEAATRGTPVLFISESPFSLLNQCLSDIQLTLEVLGVGSSRAVAVGVTLTPMGQGYVPWYRAYSSLPEALRRELLAVIEGANSPCEAGGP